MWSANNGEWAYEGRTIFPEPLRHPEPDRQLEPELRNEERTEPNERDSDYECIGEWTTDWGPELQRMSEYRILAGSEEAESGEEYFTGNSQTGFYRRYRPTRSEREAKSEANGDKDEINDIQDMEVDESPSVTRRRSMD